MRSPLTASCTAIWHKLLSRAAKLVVKPGGMCWVITMPGESAGRRVNTSLIASVPPVEAPMQISFSVDMCPRFATAVRVGTAAPAATAAGEATIKRLMWDAAAMRTFSTI